MEKKIKKDSKNLILFVGRLSQDALDSIKKYGSKNNVTFRTGLIYKYNKKKPARKEKILKKVDVALECADDSANAIQEALAPHQKDIISITCHGEINIPFFQKIIPHLLKTVHTPSVESLGATTNKITMRRALTHHNKNLTPSFMVVDDDSKKTLKKIQENIKFPLVVKPAGLAASLLVSICYHEDELEEVLKKTFKKLNAVYEERKGRGKPQVLVEQFMDGDIYSIDAFISPKGKIYFAPPVRAINGRSIGFDDFFEYKLLTPTALNKRNLEKAEEAATEAVRATKLTSSSSHIELMKTERGWKVIELGPRVGGWRDDMYRLSYGIEHRMNDILIRIPRKPIIPKKELAHTAVMQFYPKKEGRLVKTQGIKKSRELKSFYNIKVRKKIGDMCRFAKNGDKPIFDITLSNISRTGLLADIRRLEQSVYIETK